MRFLPNSEEAYYEMLAEEQSRPATEAEADREYARNKGMDHPEQAWILSDRDVWYPNPSYRGPRVPHPESYEAEEL
jgi:hypothetical protein